MGVLNWLKGVDQRFIDESKDRAVDFGARAAEAQAARQGQYVDNLVGGQATAEKLGPELLYHLRQQAMGRKAPDEVTGARARLASMLGTPPDGTTASRDALIQQLIASGVTGQGGAPTVLDPALMGAIADLQAASSPGMNARVMGALQGANQQFASNPWARGAAYGSLTVPAAVGGMGLTEAGMGLLELAGILESEDQADQAEMQRQGRV